MKRKAKNRQSRILAAQTPALEPMLFQPFLSHKEYDMLLEEIRNPLLPCLRVNPLKTSSGFSAHLADKYGWNLERIPFCPTGYRVSANQDSSISNTLEHRLGMYYIQEAASMLPVELFSIQEEAGLFCLDLAASPGGKTNHLVGRLQDRGLIIANDSSKGRIQALRIVLRNWGAVNCAITRFPGEKFGAWYPGTFDRVLLDAPCSMQGLRTTESHPIRPVTDKESQQLAGRQTTLLASAVQAARVGGEIVYSTCTLLPEEDEAVIDATLRRFASRLCLLDAQKFLPTPAPGLTDLLGEPLSDGMEKTVRLWPHRYRTAGFYAAIMQKIDEITLPTAPPPAHSMQQAGYVPFSHMEEIRFCAQFFDTWGFDLGVHLSQNRSTLMQHETRVYVIPALLLEHFGELPVQSTGLLLGEELTDGFLPGQDWVFRFGSQCRKNIVTLDSVCSLKWLQGENININNTAGSSPSNYRIIINDDNLALGCGKVTRTELKNLAHGRFN